MAVVNHRDRYHTLDAMRGVAAFLVAAYHLQQRSNGGTIAGYLAVDLFFVLSGFVIALNYTERFADHLSVFRFMQLRIIRLFPLYALGLALGLAKLTVGFMLHIPPAVSVGNIPCAAIFGAALLPDPCSVELFPLNGPSWSLFFEIAINLVFGICLWRWSVGRLALLMVASVISFYFLITPPDYFNVGWAWHNFAGGISRTIFSFCAGVVLFRFSPHLRRRASWAALLPIVGLLAILGFQWPAASRVGLEICTIVLVFPMLVVAGCSLEAPGRLARSISSFLGDLSYPIYVVHWPLIAIALPVATRFRIPPPISIAIFLTVLVPIAFLAAWMDEAFRQRLGGLLKRRPRASAHAT